MKRLLIATKNEGKFREIVHILSGINFEIVSLKDFPVDYGEPEEDGETFRDNAKKKAEFFYNKTGILTLADDSGIFVDAFPGQLGVKTRRWGLGKSATEEQWITHFLREAEVVPDGERGAKFICTACLKGEGVEEFFEGETEGVLTRQVEAPIIDGLSLSSCFIPKGFSLVYAAMGPDGKSKVSHRGKAFAKVKEFLISM